MPEVVAPGALDIVNFVGPDGVPARFHDRVIHGHNGEVMLMRSTAEEGKASGIRIAERLNEASGPTTLLFPTRGFSALDFAGGPFCGPDADAALLEALRRHCRLPVEVRALDLHSNDPAFARTCCETLLASLPRGAEKGPHA